MVVSIPIAPSIRHQTSSGPMRRWVFGVTAFEESAGGSVTGRKGTVERDKNQKNDIDNRYWWSIGCQGTQRTKRIRNLERAQRLTKCRRIGNQAWRMVITLNLHAVENIMSKAHASSFESSVNELKAYPKPKVVHKVMWNKIGLHKPARPITSRVALPSHMRTSIRACGWISSG